MNDSRIEKLQKLAKDKGVDYLFIVPGPNLYYFTGLDMGMSERPTMAVVPAEGEIFFCCPSFELEKIKRETGVNRFVTYKDEEGPYKALREWLTAHKTSDRLVVAFEYRTARLLEYSLIRETVIQCELVDARSIMAELRMQKDDEELAHMQRAAELADIMVKGVREALVPGVKESLLHRAARMALAKADPEAEVAFIEIGSGERSVLPHWGLGDRKIQSGEFVVIDLGARYKGYCSDITRTLPVGEISEEMRTVYDIVKLANEKAKETAKPGVSAADVDRVARAIIEEQGYGEYFSHRTGHGLGIEVHEEPYIVQGNDLVLRSGMTLTVEPGIYIPGKFGVRIEDDIVITEDGSRVLTEFPRHLVY